MQSMGVNLRGSLACDLMQQGELGVTREKKRRHHPLRRGVCILNVDADSRTFQTILVPPTPIPIPIPHSLITCLSTLVHPPTCRCPLDLPGISTKVINTTPATAIQSLPVLQAAHLPHTHRPSHLSRGHDTSKQQAAVAPPIQNLPGLHVAAIPSLPSTPTTGQYIPARPFPSSASSRAKHATTPGLDADRLHLGLARSIPAPPPRQL